MTSRFVSNLTTLLAGAALVVFTLGLGLSSAAWVAFGVGCLVTVLSLVAFAFPGRGHGQRALDIAVIVVAGWTIVASRTFDGAALKWLVFGGGCIMAALALCGLVAHEARMERAVRQARSAASDGKVTHLPERAPAGIAR